MTGEKLYQSLIEIGLEDYLKQIGNGNIYQEAHMLKIDSFVKNLSDDQKKILKDKISKKKNETHAQHNDMLHEISIACAFYDKVNFLPETNEKTPDFCSNDICVEVKTIDNSDIERKRQDELNKGPYCNISPALNQKEVEDIKKEFIECVGKKFTEHINKAKEQLNPGGGHIWIIYAIDSPPKFYEKINKEIENRFDEIIKKLQPKNFCIRYINFESLREKIAN
ncbi:hypothetical protein HYT45_04770 [Candidatus Uhrbacteria bacterium]|nr:hypothetical protein [Candidatus Uhrbacteria bacterium]MBI2175620.1 hypothetical protein [Parcubacteria group bacterium]